MKKFAKKLLLKTAKRFKISINAWNVVKVILLLQPNNALFIPLIKYKIVRIIKH